LNGYAFKFYSNQSESSPQGFSNLFILSGSLDLKTAIFAVWMKGNMGH